MYTKPLILRHSMGPGKINYMFLKSKVTFSFCELEDKYQVSFWQELGDCLLDPHLTVLRGETWPGASFMRQT